jgi:hypothetical protein
MRRQMLHRVVPVILQNVAPRVRHLPRRFQDDRVVPIDKDLPTPPRRASVRRAHRRVIGSTSQTNGLHESFLM